MEKLHIDIVRCKGCGYCVTSCPKGALSFVSEINEKGYNYTTVDHDKCIRCGICMNVCPDCVYEILEEVK